MAKATEFLNWCNTPMFRGSGELSFRLRVQPQYPDYNTFYVIDENGTSIFNKDLTTEELYDYWVNNHYIYKSIITEYNYRMLLKSGMFWEFHPELSGDWEVDKITING